MRVKAFSLIEIIVVIILIGTIFSLILTSYTSKKNENEVLSIKDISLHVNEDATLYIYGKDCKKTIIELNNGFYVNSSSFSYKKDYIVIQKNALDLFEEVDFGTHKVEDKNEEICFKLDFKNKKFFQKFIVSAQNNYYVFSPFYQEVKELTSLEDAKEYFDKVSLYPTSMDDYHHE